ncbi:MAG: lipoprotein, partial [Bacteroidales bacterium]|nr:lipoprotein [Bacteroidales bacterium]
MKKKILLAASAALLLAACSEPMNDLGEIAPDNA